MNAETLKAFLANAPANAKYPAGLRGWWTDTGFYVCASCAGRIMARGCSLGKAEAVWADRAEPYGVCTTCE